MVGATVSLTNAGTGEGRLRKSGTGSNYQLLNLVPGIYRVNVERSSFKKAARENREVTVSGSTPADISRQLGGVTQGIEIGGGGANQGATYYGGFPANSALGNLVNMAPIPDSTSEFRVEAELATAAGEATRLDVNLKVGTVGATVEVAAQAAQIRDDSSAVTNATDAQVINDVPNVTQNALFCAMLQNGVQPRNETSTSTLGDL